VSVASLVPRQLRDSHDVLELRALFGVLFRDSFDGRVVADGLDVELRRAGTRAWQRLASHPHGAFAAHALRGLHRPVEGSPPTRRYELRMRDRLARYLPLEVGIDLPIEGLYDPGVDTASPPPREPAIPLYSAPGGSVAGGAGTVRAALRRASDRHQPASWARLQLWLGTALLGEGVADRDGELLLPCHLPPPREPPLHGSPPVPAADFERLRWDVTLRAFWDPALSGREQPDLHALLGQPEVALLRAAESPSTPLGPQVLRAGLPLVVRSDGSPFLFVGA
jgi:hypothetical protein